MANIPKLNYSFIDGQTTIMAEQLNAFVQTINALIDAVEGGSPATPIVPTMVLNTTAKTVALSAPTGLTIKYSTDGGTPTTNYSSAINVANGAIIKAITTDGTTSSSVPKITVKFNEEIGSIQFLSSQTGDIVYTTDGSTPNASSTQYSGEITPSAGTTYKVAVYNNGVLASEVSTIQIAS